MRSLSKSTIDSDSLRGQLRDNSVRVIDVRRAEDYKKDHIPKSVNLPLAELLADDSPEKVLKIAQNLGIEMVGYVYDFEKTKERDLFSVMLSVIRSNKFLTELRKFKR